MKSPFLRLIVISLLVVSWLFLSLFVLRILGSTQKYAPLNHPLWTSSSRWVFGLFETPASFKKVFPQLIQSKYKFWGAVIGVQSTKNGEWVFSSQKKYKNQDGFELPLKAFSLEEINQLLPAEKALQPLESVLKQWKPPGLIVNIESSQTFFMGSLAKILENTFTGNILVITSSSLQVLREIKKIKPLWIYAYPEEHLLKAKIFSALFIETMSSLEGDIYLTTSLSPHNILKSPRLAQELHKRYKLLFFLDTPPFRETSQVIQSPHPAILTKRPVEILKAASKKVLE